MPSPTLRTSTTATRPPRSWTRSSCVCCPKSQRATHRKGGCRLPQRAPRVFARKTAETAATPNAPVAFIPSTEPGIPCDATKEERTSHGAHRLKPLLLGSGVLAGAAILGLSVTAYGPETPAPPGQTPKHATLSPAPITAAPPPTAFGPPVGAPPTGSMSDRPAAPGCHSVAALRRPHLAGR